MNFVYDFLTLYKMNIISANTNIADNTAIEIFKPTFADTGGFFKIVRTRVVLKIHRNHSFSHKNQIKAAITLFYL